MNYPSDLHPSGESIADPHMARRQSRRVISNVVIVLMDSNTSREPRLTQHILVPGGVNKCHTAEDLGNRNEAADHGKGFE